MSQYTLVYYDRSDSWLGKAVCHDTNFVSLLGQLGGLRSVSQYSLLYCDRGAGGMALYLEAGPRHGSQARAQRAATRRWGAYDTAITPCDTAECHGHDTAVAAQNKAHARAPGRACAHLGGLVRPTGCALGAPSLFLDSILFLSHFLVTVHHKKIPKKIKFN